MYAVGIDTRGRGLYVMLDMYFLEQEYGIIIPLFSVKAWRMALALRRNPSAAAMAAYRKAGYEIELRPNWRTRAEFGVDDE